MSDWSLLYFTVDGLALLGDAASWIIEQVLPGLRSGRLNGWGRTLILRRIRTKMSHPTIPDSALNYDTEVSKDYAGSLEDFKRVENEPGCSPHPFDVMALYALYQTEAGEDD